MRYSYYILFALLLSATGCKKNKCETVHCISGFACDSNTGSCVGSCPYGYRGVNCTEKIPDCELSHFSVLNMFNSQPNPYDVYIDDVYLFTAASQSRYYKKLTTGNHTFKAVQASGFVLYPTVFNSQANFIQCNTVVIDF